MNSISEIMCLCRLCLEKEDVNTPIFEEQGEIGQISLKISTCLPVKVSKEDDLPKNICGGCLCKLEMFYQFWNTCANADKKLVKWIDQISVNKISDKRESAASNVLIQHSIDSNPIVLKQEVMEIVDTQSDDLVSEHLNMSNDDQDYLLQQQSLTYEPVEFQFQQDEFETVAEDDSSNAGVQSHSQHKRVAAMRSLSHVESEDEDDPDSMNAHITKTEDDTDDSGEGDPKPTTFVGLPPDDNVQAGTSTAVQSIRDAPYFGEMGIRKVNMSLDNVRSLNKYKVMFEKYKLKYLLKHGVVILGDLAKLDFNKFLPSKSMAKYLASKPGCVVDQNQPEETLSMFGKYYLKQQYSCKHCKETFKHELQLKRHKMIHFMKNNSTFGMKESHTCYICRRTFAERYLLWSHLRQHSEKLQHKCKHCNKMFKSSNAVEVHRINCKKSIKDDPKIGVPDLKSSFRYRCNICLTKFEDIVEMRIHKESHYENDDEELQDNEKNNIESDITNTFAPCETTVSQGVYNPRTTYTKHMLQDSPELFDEETKEVLRCDVCYDVLQNNEAYLEHVKLHSEIFKSSHTSEVSLDEKVDIASGNAGTAIRENEDSTLQIRGCIDYLKPKISVKKLTDLMPNNFEFPSVKEKKKPHATRGDFKCDECSLKFKRYRSLRKHNRVAKTKYKCSLCAFATCSTKYFRTHFRTEHNVDFVCLKCKAPCEIHNKSKPKTSNLSLPDNTLLKVNKL